MGKTTKNTFWSGQNKIVDTLSVQSDGHLFVQKVFYSKMRPDTQSILIVMPYKVYLFKYLSFWKWRERPGIELEKHAPKVNKLRINNSETR